MTMRSKGFTFVEALTVVCLIMILAMAISPMYTSSVIKAKTTNAVNAASGLTSVLQNWWQKQNNFDNITVETPEGGSLLHNGMSFVGGGLPCLQNVEWTVTTGPDSIAIDWNFLDGCDPALCNGRYCLACGTTSIEKCEVAVQVGGPGDPFGYGGDPNAICP